MINIEHHRDIAAPIEDVWRTLVAFERWDRWHPHRRIAGTPALHARVFHLVPRAHPLRRKSPAWIDVLEEGRRMRFKFGRWPTGYSFEEFAVEQIRRRTRLTQIAIVPNWTPLLHGGVERYQAMVRESYRQVAEALEQHLVGARKSRLGAGSSRRGRM